MSHPARDTHGGIDGKANGASRRHDVASHGGPLAEAAI